jgi:hypothetical protein
MRSNQKDRAGGSVKDFVGCTATGPPAEAKAPVGHHGNEIDAAFMPIGAA